MNNIRLHFHKYIFYYILAIAIFFIISVICVRLYNDYQISKNATYDFYGYDSFMNEVYRIKPSLFEFDDHGIAKVEMNDLLKPISNGKDTIYFGEVPLTKEQDQCVGYILVKLENGLFKYDYSHLCEMVDY